MAARLEVELSLTVWERTYRRALTADFIQATTASMKSPFSQVSIVINNVEDRADAADRAAALVTSGDISSFAFVQDEIQRALHLAGLTQRMLRPLPHYTDHLLVKMAQQGPRYICHWDTDCRLDEHCDWVTPSAEHLSKNADALVAVPSSSDRSEVAAEELFRRGDFSYGFGFTDLAFLADRHRLALPIYRFISPATWWFPTAHLTPIFEQRLDSYMRRRRLMHATYLPATFHHLGHMAVQPMGNYIQRLRRHAMWRINELCRTRAAEFHPVWTRRPPPQEASNGPGSRIASYP